MKLESPKRSASSTTMTVAFGTSMPTSMTLVATSTCVRRPAAHASRRAFIDPHPPVQDPGHAPPGGPSPRRVASSIAASTWSPSDSSINGQTTYACRPASTWSRTYSYTRGRLRWDACTYGPATVPGGASATVETSRSPYNVSAQRARDRRRGHDEHVGPHALFAERHAVRPRNGAARRRPRAPAVGPRQRPR